MVEHLGNAPSQHQQYEYGLGHATLVHWNCLPALAYEHAIRRGEGILTASGQFAAITTPHTGRSPKDKFILREPSTEDDIWWGQINQPIEQANFDSLYERMAAHLKDKEVFVNDLYVCSDPSYRMNVRVISENAWQNLFARNVFLRPADDELADMNPEFTILHTPTLYANPEQDGTNSEMFVAISFERKLVLISGSRYAGEIKKSIFTVLNYLLPRQHVLPMHCSANLGPDGDVALFFGLSGTGKTTLSAVPGRRLIGDDEHGWHDKGVFNFEGGNYAKAIRLSEEGEPAIYSAVHSFGTIIENVVVDDSTRLMDLDNDSITENTRACYPIEFIDNAVIPSVAGHPQNIFFLTADAFGVMPPISHLTPEQSMYHFLAGYTAKIAGTERGVRDPQATFSACFAEPFLPLHPVTYAKMLGKNIEQHNTKVWLVNTGWTGGPYGVGHRIKLAYTRAMVNAALSGTLDDVPTEADPVFGLHVPTTCPNVPEELLMPRSTWSDGAAYDQQAHKLAQMFVERFALFEEYVEGNVIATAPSVA